MNARFESEHDYLTHQTLLMGLGSGGVISDIPSMSQSYRRAVLRNPPKGDFSLIVLPPVKQGSTWHYGGRVVAAPSSSPAISPNGKEFKEYTIWRKWEDCLDLQKTVEREYSFLSFRRRRQAQLGSDTATTTSVNTATSSSGSTHPRSSSPVDMYGASSYYAPSPNRMAEPAGLHSEAAMSIYKQPRNRAASFESLPQGLEPLAVAVDVHVLIPKLSKKAALWGKPSAQLLAQRSQDFKAFIEAIFTIHTPAMDDLRQSRSVRDWFGWWKRDKESMTKAGMPIPASPASSNSPTDIREELPPVQERSMSLAIPAVEHRSSSASSNSASSESLGLEEHDASGSEDDEELHDMFPMTPQGVSSSGNFSTPIIRTNHDSSSSSSSHHQHRGSAGSQQFSPPRMPVKLSTPPSPKSPPPSHINPYVGLSVGGMMAPPAPLSRSTRSGSGSSQPPRSPTQRQAPPRPTPPSPSQRIFTPGPDSYQAPPTVRTPRAQRPSTAGASTNRQGRVFIVEPERRPRSANPLSSEGRRGGLKVNTSDTSMRAPPSPRMVEASRSAIEPSSSRMPVPPPPQSSSSRSSPTIRNNRPRAQTMGYGGVPVVDEAALAATLQNFHAASKKSMDSETGSFLNYALPAWSVPPVETVPEQPTVAVAEDVEPAAGRRKEKKRGPTGRGGRHSISSIESYLSDSSIDAALSTLRMAEVAPPSPLTSLPPVSPLRRSMSTGASSVARHRSSSFASRVEQGAVDDRNRERRMLAAALMDEDEDVVDSYFYNSSPIATRRPSIPSNSTMATSPTSPASFITHLGSHRSNSISSSRNGGNDFDIFNLKVLFPSFTDCAAIALRLPRTTTFDELQVRLHMKFHEAEGIDLSKFERGFRLGYRPGRRVSMQSVVLPEGEGRERSMSVGSGTTMVDPALLSVIKNDDDWKHAIPGPREKLTLQVIVD